MPWGRLNKNALFLVGMIFIFPCIVFAEDISREEISFNVPQGFYQKACRDVEWSGTQVQWKGIQDARSDRELGLVTKKNGKDPIRVFSVEPMDQVLDLSLRQLFRTCGLKLIHEKAKAGPEVISLKAELRDFSAKEEKALLTGKGRAKINLVFYARRGNKKITADVGYQLEFRQGRKRGIKNLRKILQELYLKAIAGIPQAPSFQQAIGLNSI